MSTELQKGDNMHPSLLFGSRIEMQCSRGHRTWHPLEETAFVCACGAVAVRTGRVQPSALAARDLIGASKPSLHGVESKAAGVVESYKLHVKIPLVREV